MKISFPQGGI